MNLGSLIVDDPREGVFRVHRRTMLSEEILAEERARIFARVWQYVGHESELDVPGAYRRRRVAGRPLVFVRGSDGAIRALHNTCPHRGAIVCRQDAGVAKTFQCFYHAWTFDNRGSLVGLPDQDGYAPGFDRGERSLAPVARHESYRGFHFVCFDRNVEPLVAYLAGAREMLDLIVDQSLDGSMKVVKGEQRYSIRANWKLLAENSVDGYHAAPVHKTYLGYLQGTGALRPGDAVVAGRGRSLGNGHGCIEYRAPWGRPVARWAPTFGEAARAEIESIRSALERKHGPERAQRIADWNRNLLIFPNLVVNDIMAVTIRTFQPRDSGSMDVTAWELAPAEEGGERLTRRLQNFLEFLGPGGFATPDDVEALDSCQIGFDADGVEWSDVSRGMAREALSTDELQMRAFWREWQARMSGAPRADWSDARDSA